MLEWEQEIIDKNTANCELNEEELNGHIYDVGFGSQAYVLMRTTKEIAEYTGRTCNCVTDIRHAIKKQEGILIKLVNNTTG